MRKLLLSLVAWLVTAAHTLLPSRATAAEQPFPPHRVVGNVYYVGSEALAVYLVTTPEGHILINSGFEETVPLVRASVESLGFKLKDVKLLLASHAHSDHVAGHARLQQLTGAQVIVMQGDDAVIGSGGEGQYLYSDSRWTPCKVDRVVKDGEQVQLGGTTLVAHRTPGHTPGCTTWAWDAQEAGRTYRVVVIGSPNVNPGYQLVANRDYPEIAADFLRTFERLRKLPCDIFLGAHGNYYGLAEKYPRLREGGQNPFLDPQGYRRYVADKEREFHAKLAAQQAALEGEIRAAVQPFVDRQVLAGAVALVGDSRQVLAQAAVGFANVETGRSMSSDAVFWIASQSKPITAAAVMMLVDEGRLQLDDPVHKHLPEFREQLVVAERDEQHVMLVRPRRPMTLRDVLSHTSGLPFRSALETPTLDRLTLADRVRSYAMTPLEFQPGAKYQYSNAGINTAARIVEVVSGKSFAAFLDERLFGPLGMQDTSFWPTADQLSRLAGSYKPAGKEAGLAPTTIDQLHYPLDDRQQRTAVPAGGLFSTARDLLRFYQLLVNGGELEGRRYLSAAAVQQLTSKQTPDEVKQPYGLGFSVGGGRFGHGGAYSTNSYFDRERGLVFVWLVQHAGFPGDGGQAQDAFRQAVLHHGTSGSAAAGGAGR